MNKFPDLNHTKIIQNKNIYEVVVQITMENWSNKNIEGNKSTWEFQLIWSIHWFLEESIWIGRHAPICTGTSLYFVAVVVAEFK